MWTPVELKLKNFRSFFEETLEFKQGTYLIQGVNKTDSGSVSNGSGKSSLREALCFVLGLPTFIDTNVDFINNNAENCSVTFSLKNSVNNDLLEITRTLAIKGSSKLKVSINGVDQSEKFSTVPEGDKYIIDLIGISKDDLLNHYIISKEKFKSIFSSSDTKVKELISRFSNFNKFDGVEDLVQQDVNKLNEELTKLIAESNKFEGKLEYLEQKIMTEQQKDPEAQKSTEISRIESQIEEHIVSIERLKEGSEIEQKNIINFNNQIEISNTKINTLEEELNSLEEIHFDKDIEELNLNKSSKIEERKKIESQVLQLQRELKEINRSKNEIENSIESAIKCPKCLHEFVLNSEISIEEAKELLPVVLKEINDFTEKINTNSEKIDEIHLILNDFNTQLDKINGKISDFNRHKSEMFKKINEEKSNKMNIELKIKRCNSNIQNNSIDIDDKFKVIESLQQEIEMVMNKEILSMVEEIKKGISEITKQQEEIEKQIQAQKDKIYEKEQWIFRFKKFRSKLANESLEIIQGYANMYLKNMKTNLNVQIEGFRQNKDGSIREKISPVILRNGEQEGSGSFKKCSGGERGKIDLATSILAIQSLINNSSPNGGLDLVWIDEVLESVDVLGLENIAESISQLNKICLITSHVQHDKVYNNIITVEKLNGVSKILN